jgi:hypothetical protein
MTDDEKRLKNVIVTMASNREPERQTKQCLAAMQRLGAGFIMCEGHSDVTQARNHALSVTCEQLRNYPERDCVLMMDDDMIVPLETAELLIRTALETGHACSAAYATAAARLAGGRWKPKGGEEWPTGLRVRWVAGLGCVAIPAKLLLELEQRSESYQILDRDALRVLTQFTWSKAEGGEWVAEDYRLCRELGGVMLLPVGVGHVKKGEIWPDDETLAAIKEGRPVKKLPGGAIQE